LTPLELKLRRVKATDRETISGVVRRLRKTNIYMAVGQGGKEGMEEACKAGVIQRRYISTLLCFNFY
jgi:hypothetical protein